MEERGQLSRGELSPADNVFPDYPARCFPISGTRVLSSATRTIGDPAAVRRRSGSTIRSDVSTRTRHACRRAPRHAWPLCMSSQVGGLTLVRPSQPLLDFEELDPYVRHAGHYPLVCPTLIISPCRN
jgi:hypothetical protein